MPKDKTEDFDDYELLDEDGRYDADDGDYFDAEDVDCEEEDVEDYLEALKFTSDTRRKFEGYDDYKRNPLFKDSMPGDFSGKLLKNLFEMPDNNGKRVLIWEFVKEFVAPAGFKMSDMANPSLVEGHGTLDLRIIENSKYAILITHYDNDESTVQAYKSRLPETGMEKRDIYTVVLPDIRTADYKNDRRSNTIYLKRDFIGWLGKAPLHAGICDIALPLAVMVCTQYLFHIYYKHSTTQLNMNLKEYFNNKLFSDCSTMRDKVLALEYILDNTEDMTRALEEMLDDVKEPEVQETIDGIYKSLSEKWADLIYEEHQSVSKQFGDIIISYFYFHDKEEVDWCELYWCIHTKKKPTRTTKTLAKKIIAKADCETAGDYPCECKDFVLAWGYPLFFDMDLTNLFTAAKEIIGE